MIFVSIKMFVCLSILAFTGFYSVSAQNANANKTEDGYVNGVCDYSDKFSKCSIDWRTKQMKSTVFYTALCSQVAKVTKDISICDRAYDPEVCKTAFQAYMIMQRLLAGQDDGLGKDEELLKDLCLAFKNNDPAGLTGWDKDFYDGVKSRDKELLKEAVFNIVMEMEEYPESLKTKDLLMDLTPELIIMQDILNNSGKEVLKKRLEGLDFKCNLYGMVFFYDEPLALLDDESILRDIALFLIMMQTHKTKAYELMQNEYLKRGAMVELERVLAQEEKERKKQEEVVAD